MELPQLKEIAAAKGIELPLRTRMTTYISHILGEAEDGVAVEVTEPPVTITTDSGTKTSNAAWNGNVDIEVVADKVSALVIEKLVDGLEELAHPQLRQAAAPRLILSPVGGLSLLWGYHT